MNYQPSKLLRYGLLLLVWALGAAAPAKAQHLLYDADGRRLEVQIDQQFSAHSREQVTAWAEQLAASLKLVYGHWPRDRWVIEVEAASGSADDPIPWAKVSRGSVDRITFYVLPNSSTETLLREWTGYHEVSHLLLPYRGWGDTWFSEGLATYYQNLLQARTGLLNEKEMWQRLYDGFVRGREDSRFDGKPLIEVNQQMRSSGGYMRVYWSGAWYFLAADLQLRANSGGAASLDDALLALNDCCARDALSVPEIIQRMDANLGSAIFDELFQAVRLSTQLPDFEPLFAQLGITIVDGEVLLRADGDAARRRLQFLHSTAL